jgi:hypothetical protein
MQHSAPWCSHKLLDVPEVQPRGNRMLTRHSRFLLQWLQQSGEIEALQSLNTFFVIYLILELLKYARHLTNWRLIRPADGRKASSYTSSMHQPPQMDSAPYLRLLPSVSLVFSARMLLFTYRHVIQALSKRKYKKRMHFLIPKTKLRSCPLRPLASSVC